MIKKYDVVYKNTRTADEDTDNFMAYLIMDEAFFGRRKHHSHYEGTEGEGIKIKIRNNEYNCLMLLKRNDSNLKKISLTLAGSMGSIKKTEKHLTNIHSNLSDKLKLTKQ